MPSGTLDIFLVSASGVKKVDFFSKTDPYVVIQCGAQNQKSNIARNQGSNPSWNQRFLFYVDDDVQEITYCKDLRHSIAQMKEGLAESNGKLKDQWMHLSIAWTTETTEQAKCYRDT
ncbi:hypothetical protein KP509_36G039100 [Ceratopteris richardii]|uniref:C2 domain-containing protein n=1 Tax=Ceratopteris richardii TaxID=49495 RepID=A0A8T2QCU2_CERRI|nr:hypothetical protein KP509_36G039100 [Ceratopteris richardii]